MTRFFLFVRHLVCVFCVASALFGTTATTLAATSALSAPPLIPNDTFWDKQWDLRQIHAPEAWAVTTGSRDVVVAVIDGGIDINHPDLRDNIWMNDKEIPGDGIDNEHDEYVDDVHGWNFVTNSPDVRPVFKQTQLEDAWSHGTLVASLLGAKGNDGNGIAGMTWNVRIMPLVVLNADGQGQVSDIVKAIRYAVSHGANVINFSLVGYDYDDELDLLMRNAASAGVVLVAATGNDPDTQTGINLDDIPAYPVCMDGGHNGVIGVSGTDTLDQKAPYANYGKWCTDIAAPAQELFAARPSYAHNVPSTTSTIPLYLDKVTGTSLAAPLVSGVAALLKSVHPDWSAEQIRHRIIETADPVEENLPEDLKGKLGSGRLNAGRALSDLIVVPAGATSTLMTSVASSSVTLIDPLGQRTTWQPYGPKLRGGIQRVTLSDDHWLLWPTQGGGHALVIDGDGKTLQNFFPFGAKRIGRWSLKLLSSDAAIQVNGPSGFRGRLLWQDHQLSVL